MSSSGADGWMDKQIEPYVNKDIHFKSSKEVFQSFGVIQERSTTNQTLNSSTTIQIGKGVIWKIILQMFLGVTLLLEQEYSSCLLYTSPSPRDRG
eukprot:3726514-Amphidinium_carterae.1